jgi:hypothetical protein
MVIRDGEEVRQLPISDSLDHLQAARDVTRSQNCCPSTIAIRKVDGRKSTQGLRTVVADDSGE